MSTEMVLNETGCPYATIIPTVMKSFGINGLACIPKSIENREIIENNFSLGYANVISHDFITDIKIVTDEIDDYKTLDYIEVTTPLGDAFILKSIKKYMNKDQESIMQVVDLMHDMIDYDEFASTNTLSEGEYSPARFLMRIIGVPATATIISVPLCHNREVKIVFTLQNDEPAMEGYEYTLYVGINDKKQFQYCVMGVSDDGEIVFFPDHSFYDNYKKLGF